MSDKECTYYLEMSPDPMDEGFRPCCKCGWKGEKQPYLPTSNQPGWKYSEADYSLEMQWERHIADRHKKAPMKGL